MNTPSLSCPVCCTALPALQLQGASAACPACGVDLRLMQHLQASAPATPARPAATAKVPARPSDFLGRLGRTALVCGGALGAAFALLGLGLSLAFDADLARGMLVGAQFGLLLGTVFALTWTALDQYEPVLLWGPVISGAGSAVVGLINHAVITRSGLMPDLSLFESVEVTSVAGIVAGIIAGAIKQRNA